MENTVLAFNHYLNGFLAGYRDASKEYTDLEPIETPLREVGFSDEEIDELLLTLEGDDGALFIPRSKYLIYKFVAYGLLLEEEEITSPRDILQFLDEKGFQVSGEDAEGIFRQMNTLDF